MNAVSRPSGLPLYLERSEAKGKEVLSWRKQLLLYRETAPDRR